MTYLADMVTVSPRFSKAVTVGDAASVRSLDGYVPTARALEAVARVAVGIGKGRSRAFSVIGPYGSGKSSFAVFLNAILGSDPSLRKIALGILDQVAPDLADTWRENTTCHTPGDGWALAMVTAPQREPITVTMLRALTAAAHHAAIPASVANRADRLTAAALDRSAAPVSSADVLDLLDRIAKHRPVLLLIDEFGKNLEAYADNSSDADLYLLQSLAEYTANRRSAATPVVIITVQHLAFEAYAEAATTAQRREWAKVQGRFEDVPFIDTAAGVRQLVSRALRQNPDLRDAVRAEVELVNNTAARIGLPTGGPDTIASCYPLHPVSLAVLPDLCARFGQNERTLFSFVASAEPLAMPALMARMDLPDEGPVPWVRLDSVYDYFVESTSTLAGASRDATRWAEITSAMRDAATLPDAERIVLKAIGVLNLVSAHGSMRASGRRVAFAVRGAHPDLGDDEAVAKVLGGLCAAGVLVFRDFADEYRLWRGSDFDLTEAMDLQRRRLSGGVDERAARVPLAVMLTEAHPLRPLVAGQHSVETLTVRSFQRIWVNGVIDEDIRKLIHTPIPYDGTVVYLTGIEIPDDLRVASAGTDFPVIAVTPASLGELRKATVEVAALTAVRDSDDLPEHDTAVRTEIDERLDYAGQRLAKEVATAYAAGATWSWLNGYDGEEELGDVATTSALSQKVLKRAYKHAPIVRYEALNRHELTSSGSRIRTNLIRSLVDPAVRRIPAFGYEEGSAEESAYYAIYDRPCFDFDKGLYPSTNEGVAWRECWKDLCGTIRASGHRPLPVSTLIRTMAGPPYGLRAGITGLLLATALVLDPEKYLLYEHGSFVRELDDGVLERMGRNPADFSVAAPTIGDSKQGTFLRTIAATLGAAKVPGQTMKVTIPTVASRLVHLVTAHPDKFTQTSTAFSRAYAEPDQNGPDDHQLTRTVALRNEVLAARDPWQLIFTAVPTAMGFDPVVKGHGGPSADDIEELARRLRDAAERLWGAHNYLVRHVTARIFAALGVERLRDTWAAVECFTDHSSDEEWVLAKEGAAAALLNVPTQQFVLRTVDLRNSVGGNPDRLRQRDAVDWVERLTQGLTGKALSQWREGDIPSGLRTITTVAADLRQAAALHAVNDNTGTYALRLTAAGDEETTMIVGATPTMSQATDRLLDTMLAEFGKTHDVDPTTALSAIAARTLRRLADRGGEDRP